MSDNQNFLGRLDITFNRTHKECSDALVALYIKKNILIANAWKLQITSETNIYREPGGLGKNKCKALIIKDPPTNKVWRFTPDDPCHIKTLLCLLTSCKLQPRKRRRAGAVEPFDNISRRPKLDHTQANDSWTDEPDSLVFSPPYHAPGATPGGGGAVKGNKRLSSGVVTAAAPLAAAAGGVGLLGRPTLSFDKKVVRKGKGQGARLVRAAAAAAAAAAPPLRPKAQDILKNFGSSDRGTLKQYGSASKKKYQGFQIARSPLSDISNINPFAKKEGDGDISNINPFAKKECDVRQIAASPLSQTDDFDPLFQQQPSCKEVMTNIEQQPKSQRGSLEMMFQRQPPNQTAGLTKTPAKIRSPGTLHVKKLKFSSDSDPMTPKKKSRPRILASFEKHSISRSGGARLDGGFKNLGNTCYQNAMLQALLRISSFSDALFCPSWLALAGAQKSLDILQKGAKTLVVDDENKENAALPSLYSCLVQIVFLLRQGNTQPLDLSLLKRVFEKHTGNRFKGVMQQHDAHEYMVELFSALEQELTPMMIDEIDASLQIPTDAVFSMQIESEFKCLDGCDYSRRKTEIYMDLSLDLLTAFEGPQTLEHLLSKFFEPNDLQLDCEKCENHAVTKSPKLKALPKVLLVHIKRFKYNAKQNVFNKSNAQVVIPKFLDLTKHMAPGQRGESFNSTFCGACERKHDAVCPSNIEIKKGKKVGSSMNEGPQCARKEQEEDDEDLQRAIQESLEINNTSPSMLMVKTWICPTCTLINEPVHLACEICGGERPQSTDAMQQEKCDENAARWNDEVTTAVSGLMKPLPSAGKEDNKETHRPSGSASYQLQAIVHHVGEDAVRGHYITSVCTSSSDGAANGFGKDVEREMPWKIYDDSYSKEVSEQHIFEKKQQETAYICCYVHLDH